MTDKIEMSAEFNGFTLTVTGDNPADARRRLDAALHDFANDPDAMGLFKARVAARNAVDPNHQARIEHERTREERERARAEAEQAYDEAVEEANARPPSFFDKFEGMTI